MSEDQAQEKTEEATPKKLEKAKEDGQIPRSKELTTTAVLLAGSCGLLFLGSILADKLFSVTKDSFMLERDDVFDTSALLVHLGTAFYEAIMGLMPIFALLLIASIVGPIGLGGWMFSVKSLAPKLSRMNPLEGLKKMFSTKSLVELFKALAKISLVMILAIILLKSLEKDMMNLATENIDQAIAHAVEMVLWVTLGLSLATILIAMVDIPFQIWDHKKKMKMSVQDIKDEMKDTEGKPEVKGRIRQLQREIANRKMLSDVPKADVVITNPTHYAIALQYDPETMATPILLAKGVDQMALKIREIAAAHKVEIIESPALARSIYHTTKIEETIPSGLFLAVAKVLAYVYQLRRFRQGKSSKPSFPYHIDVPKDLRFD